MFGNLGEMAKLMQLAKELPRKIKDVKEELSRMEYTATSVDGTVKATVSGDFMLKKIEFIAAPGEISVVEAVNTAIGMAKTGAQEKMKEATGGMDLPDIF